MKDRKRHFTRIFFLLLGEGAEGATEIAAAYVKFTSQQARQGQPKPLPQPNAREYLLPGMIEGGLDGVDGGDGHSKTSLLRAR